MKRVVFCEVTWMKYYGGVSENDKPMNGGKYIDENETGGEVYNFDPYNHKCYGYVMHYGDELHIERYGKAFKTVDEIENMTVVWVASDGKSSKIVGWYENATMYRFWHSYYDIVCCGDQVYDYNFVAHEKDCYLIDEKDRSFVVPRASIAGKGRGMGQAQVWYADSEYAQNEFIPAVLEYLESMKNKCIPFALDAEKMSECAEDHGESVDELIEMGGKMICDAGSDIVEAFRYVNLALRKEDSFRTRFIKGKMYNYIGWYDEAEEEYKLALHYEETMEALDDFMYIELMLGHTFLAIEAGEKIRRRKNEAEDDLWDTISYNLIRAYTNEHEFELAEALIEECEQEKDIEHQWLEESKQYLENVRNR